MNNINPINFFSICDCYEAAFYEPIQTDDAGVSLEHIVTAVNGVELLQSCSVGIKYLTTSSASDIGNMSTRSSTLESDTKSEGNIIDYNITDYYNL